MSDEPIPQWAIDRAIELTTAIPGVGSVDLAAATFPSVRAFARYVAAHEEAPVDPLLEKVRVAWAAASNDPADEDFFVTFAAELARRGLEIREVQP